MTYNLKDEKSSSTLCVDGGATRHIISHKNPNVKRNLENLTPIGSKIQVKFADGTLNKVLGESLLHINGYVLKGLILPF